MVESKKFIIATYRAEDIDKLAERIADKYVGTGLQADYVAIIPDKTARNYRGRNVVVSDVHHLGALNLSVENLLKKRGVKDIELRFINIDEVSKDSEIISESKEVERLVEREPKLKHLSGYRTDHAEVWQFRKSTHGIMLLNEYRTYKSLKDESEARQKNYRDRKSLEGRAVSAVVAVISLIGASYFFSSNMTGFAISNVSQSSANISGAIFLLVGLVGAFFYVRNR